MFRRFIGAALVLLCVLCASSAFARDVKGSRDHSLFRRPAGYEIVEYDTGDRSIALPMDGGDIFLAGKLTEIFYRTKKQPLSPSNLGLRFVSALQRAGGEVMFRENFALEGRRVVGRLLRSGRDVWVMQDAVSLREYRLTVLETPAPCLDAPVVLNYDYEAEAQVLDLLDVVERTGKLEFSARFAPNSTTLLKGYEANFKKCVMLMEMDPSLKFFLASYPEPDLKPSQLRTLLNDRGTVLLETLVGMGADASRLTTVSPTGVAEVSVPHGFVRLTSVDSIADSVNLAAQ